MRTHQRWIRRTLSLCMATLVVALSGSASFLDARDPLQGPAIESEHQPGICHGHDHSICTQLGSRQAITAAPLPYLAAQLDRPGLPIPASRSALSARFFPEHPPRAPPLG